MKSTRYLAKSEIADPILYRTYWKLMLEDILHSLRMDVTKENKERLHEFHKEKLGYETIAGRSQDVVSMFMFEVCVFWATEYGIFVRTSKDQPVGIENYPLSLIWKLL